ncbi:MAG: hypothetical protein Q9211_000397 [Gyalolechia sp. 1 TL-2023]
MAAATQKKHSKSDPVPINPGFTIVHPDPEQSRKFSDHEIAVDIIAVPGLGANPEWTWKSKNRVDWIRDSNMLAAAIPHARIMIFEYDSKWYGKGAINQSLALLGEQLIRDLDRKRSQRGPKPPIVFVGHSLGGLVVAQALVWAKLRQSTYPDVYASVVGCIFLGVPFRGTKAQSKASAFASTIQAFGLAQNSDLLKSLKEDSKTLRDLLYEFSSLATEAKLRMFCFFEQYETELLKSSFKEMLVKESSAVIDGVGKRGLASDHFGLNKFTGPKDGAYSMVSDEISTIVQHAHSIIKSRESAQRQNIIASGDYEEIKEALGVTNPKDDMEESMAGRPASQASWVLDNEIYNQWKTMQVSQLLWIHGDPGKGQAVVASALIQELEQHAKQGNVFVAYFFCDEKEKYRRKAIDILKLLIRQMIKKTPSLAEHLLLDKSEGKKGDVKSKNWDFTTITAVWNGLQSILKDPSVGTVYFVINGIDDTDADSRNEFLTLLNSYLESQSTEEMSGNEYLLKWIFLSRSQRRDLKDSLRGPLEIDMDDEENADSVNDGVKAWISDQVDSLVKQKNFNSSLVYFVKKHIFSKAEGNYIYVNLIIQELKNFDSRQSSIANIRRFLEDFPYGLRNMFEHIHRRVLDPKSEGIEYTKEIFRSLLLAQEALDIDELAILADLPVEDRKDKSALRRYVSRCGAFVTVLDDLFGTVQWIDPTAKEYLEENAKKELSLDLSDVQHGIIALRCLDHVRDRAAKQAAHEKNMDTSEEPPERYNNESPDLNGPDGGDFDGASANAGQAQDGGPVDHEDRGQDRQFPGLQNNFDDQATADDDLSRAEDDAEVDDAEEDDAEEDGAEEDDAEEDDAEEDDAEEDDKDFEYYPSMHWIDHAKQAPPDLVKEFNLEDEFWSEISTSRTRWWDDYAECEYPGLSNVTSLHVAAIFEYFPLLNHLLENGHQNQIQKLDSWDRNPFFWACGSGNLDLVKRFLKAGADASNPGALCFAADQNHLNIVQHLLGLGAEVNVQDKTYGSPLYAAASEGSTDVARELLRSGADVNFRGGEHLRALNVAAYFGHTDIVQLLLEKDIDVHPDDDYFLGSALAAAARHGHADVIRLLLRKGWDVNRIPKTGYSALVVAARYGHAEAFQTLLSVGVDVSSRKKALEAASEKGKIEIVEKLLTNDPRLRHQEAFHRAAFHGRDDILRLLQKRGTSRELLNEALYDAADQEMQTTVDVLLKFGADPNAEGTGYGTALIAAAFDGTEQIVKSLLEYSANVNIQHHKWGNALQVAARFGNLVIVKLLLEHGAHVNTNAVGDYGSTLQAACFSGNKAVVELLLQSGAEVNARGGDYEYPIIAAAAEGRGDIVELLIDHDAHVNVNKVKGHNTPLLVLAGSTLSKETMELLLKHGADIESVSEQGTTVLIAAAACRDSEGVSMLLDKGANIYAWDSEYGTALHAAASEGDAECCASLIQHGAQVNRQCGPWNTALQAAAEAGDLDTLEILLKADADVHLSGGKFGSALQAAAFSGSLDCLQALMDHGASVDQKGGKYGTPLQAAAYAGDHECLLALKDAGSNVNYRGGKYGCAMQAAASKGHTDCFQTLMEAGASLHLRGGKYGTVLQAAVYANSSGIVTKLFEHQADVLVEGGIYGNALNAAACRGHKDVMSRLLDQGLPNEMRDRALLQAVRHRQAGAVEELLKNGASVQARDPVLGSALDILENERADDTNSDDIGDWDDEDSDDDGSDDDDSGDDDDDDDDDSGDEDEEDALDAEFARLQLKECTPEEKIRKLLNEAMAKVQRNPSIKRFRTVKKQTGARGHLNEPASYYNGYGSPVASINRKPVADNNHQNLPQVLRAGPASNHFADKTGPRIPTPATSVYQTSGDHRRQFSRPQDSYDSEASINPPIQTTGIPPRIPVLYNRSQEQPPHLPARPHRQPQMASSQSSNTPQRPSLPMATSKSSSDHQAYGVSQHTPETYGSPPTALQSYSSQYSYRRINTAKWNDYQVHNSSHNPQSSANSPFSEPTFRPLASTSSGAISHKAPTQPPYARKTSNPEGYPSSNRVARFSPAAPDRPADMYARRAASGPQTPPARPGTNGSGRGVSPPWAGDGDMKELAQGWLRKAKNLL